MKIGELAGKTGTQVDTIRFYEREGLLKPSRSEGNTRLYTDPDLERLELILSLTRDLGVNLAGVEIILNMREKMEEMQRQMQEFVSYVTEQMGSLPRETPPAFSQSLVPTRQPLPLRRKPTPSRARKAGQEV